MTGERRLFDGARLRASLFADGGERGLFVTFRHRVKVDGALEPARPLARARAAGMAHLHIQTRLNDWYVNPETKALAAVLAPLARGFTRRQAMGFSMGGYGALRLAGALRLDEVVLVSPQVSIDPAIVPFDPRYRGSAAGFDPVDGDLRRHPAPGLRGLVLFDPARALDRRNAEMIVALHPGLDPCRLGFGGHPATRVLGEGLGIGALQARLIAGGLSRAEVVGLHRRARGTSGFYRRKLDAALRLRYEKRRGESLDATPKCP